MNGMFINSRAKTVLVIFDPPGSYRSLDCFKCFRNDVVSSNLLLDVRFTDLHGERLYCYKETVFDSYDNCLIKSCDVYFYEIARKLGIDRLAATAKKFGLGEKVLQNYNEEKTGVVPDTKWKIKEIGKNWYIGETLHSGIGQGYFLSTPLQLCLMTAQLANGGFKITPKILVNKNDKISNLQKFLNYKNSKPGNTISTDEQIANFDLQPLFRNQENINLIKDAMFAATNEVGGTSYRSRHKKKEFMFAGKTGSSQIKRFTQEQREAEIKQENITEGDFSFDSGEIAAKQLLKKGASKVSCI